jgi:hypothetical protein
MKIRTVFDITGTDKGHVHGYDRYYSQLFETYVPDSILEIGVYRAHSLLAWRLLFPTSTIHGLDIKTSNVTQNSILMSDAKMIVHDSTKKTVKSVIDSTYDVIIDDGSHYYKDQIRTFKNLQNSFNKYYIIEDYMWNPNSAVKYLNRLGYLNVKVFPSFLRNVRVNINTITKNANKQNKNKTVNLSMIVITKT